MSVLNILYSIFIMPLQLFFEVVFVLANRFVHNPGLSIIVLSLAMNFLVLPLYRRADAMQEEERDIEEKLHNGVKHIKKTFKGDERMMILNTYYRQNGYKPTYVFRGAISLFLEIPFFIAAYQFLSHLELLQGVAFGPLKDLGAADALLTVGSLHINLLPIIMTAVNLVSCVIFTKGYPTKTKVQLYSMAIFFFFFLYSSPSGLVFYWTLNNIFSLVKTIFYKLKNPKKVLMTMFAFAGMALIGVGGLFLTHNLRKRALACIVLGIVFVCPLLYKFVKQKMHIEGNKLWVVPNKKIFWAASIYMVALVGAIIPSTVIKASPQEFVYIYYFYHPWWYICSAMCLAIGTFIVWFGVFYWLADDKFKGIFEIGMWILCGIATLNYMFFGKNLGTLSNVLKYQNGLVFDKKQICMNLLLVVVTMSICVVIYKILSKYIAQIILIAGCALAGMTVYNTVNINASIAELKPVVEAEKENEPSFTLSKNGKNVIVFMLDRGINEFLPFIVNEKPELKEQFSGFTYYANTVSFGAYTNFGTPALYGGYEYTPYEMNLRDEESLVSKHNEALKVMPVLFDENGYDVTVCDPTYANYQWLADTSIYDDYPDIHTFVTNGKFMDKESKEAFISANKRNFFCYSIMKISPLCIQFILYDSGNYNHQMTNNKIDTQKITSNYTAEGIYAGFMNAYSVLENLPSMTKIMEKNTNTFLMMSNDAAHEASMMQEPEYVPAVHVDNTAYETEHANRYDADGNVLNLETADQCLHYQSNMAVMLKLGEWMDYLKSEGVYDNTRIIIVADHGKALEMEENMILDDGSNELMDLESYYPLLMVKDFNSQEFTTSEELMTNADVPTLAVAQLMDNPQNPFTGKKLSNDYKANQELYVLGSDEWSVEKNNGNWFIPGLWFSIHDDVRDKENWTLLQQQSVYPIVP